jgi:flagellin
MLQRVRELAVQYKNGAMSSAGQAAIQTEVSQLASEIERIGGTAQFNGIKLLAANTTVSFQVGANDTEAIGVSLIDLKSSLGTAYYALSTTGTSDIEDIDKAINTVSAQRATFGAVQNRLDHALAATAVYQENLVSAESRIRDVDMAEEMTKMTKSQILQQAGTSMLAQANQAPQAVLSLIR